MKRIFPVCLALFLAACGDRSPTDGPDSHSELVENSAPRDLEWSELMPSDYDPRNALPERDLDSLNDDDPNAARYMELMRDVWSAAPVVKSLDQKKIRIPGFMVPIEFDDKNIQEFLLVPYFGACIHTPPPPANQIVYVKTGGFGPSPDMMWDPVWVTGTLTTEHVQNELGDAGYTLDAVTIAPYAPEEATDGSDKAQTN